MTTTATGFYGETSDRVRNRPKQSIYPLLLAGVAAGTGIRGELPDFPSPSMTHRRLPQAWICYAAREGEPENASEIWTRILWSSLEELEPDSGAWRGVFSPSYHRRALFSESIELRTATLPRWKPRVTIDRRTLERVEDE